MGAGQGLVPLVSVLTAEAASVSGFVSNAVSPALVDLPLQWSDTSLDPLYLLRKAVREHHPEMYVPAQRLVKRQRSKQQAPLERLPRMPQDESLFLQHKHLDRAQTIQARDEFARVYSKEAGQPATTARTAAHKVLFDVSAPARAAWHMVCQVARMMYKHRPDCARTLTPSCQGLPFASEAEVQACLCSHHHAGISVQAPPCRHLRASMSKQTCPRKHLRADISAQASPCRHLRSDISVQSSPSLLLLLSLLLSLSLSLPLSLPLRR